MTDEPSSVVRCQGLARRFGEGEAAVDALRGVDLEFPRGQLTSIVGPSGSGKSTLMHLLAGLDRPTEGQVWVDGTEITGLDDDDMTQLRRDKLGFVFQFFNLIPVLDAEENVTLPLRIAGRKPDPEWVDSILERVGIADRRSHRPAELSGGQQQRVAIARALIRAGGGLRRRAHGQPRLHCQRPGARRPAHSVDELGGTVIMVTHDPRVAAYADRVVLLVDGKDLQRHHRRGRRAGPAADAGRLGGADGRARAPQLQRSQAARALDRPRRLLRRRHGRRHADAHRLGEPAHSTRSSRRRTPATTSTIRPHVAVEGEFGESFARPMDESLLDRVRRVDGVAKAAGVIGDETITIVDENGDRIGPPLAGRRTSR